MKYDFRLNPDKKYNKIFIFGAGFSIDFFDFNLIDDNSIIIATNSVICKLPFCDYFIVSNWYSFRKSIMEYIDHNKTKIIACSNLSSTPCEYTDDFLQNTNVSRALLKDITDLIFIKKPVIIDYITNPIIINDIKDTNKYIKYIEDGLFPSSSGSTSSVFNIAFYLSKIYNIKTIKYVGIDLMQISNFQYPNCLLPTLDYSNHKVLKDCNYSNVQYKDINIHPSYLMQLYFLLLLIGSLDIEFYNKFESYSFLSIKDIFTYDELKLFKDYIMDKYIINRISNDIYDKGLNLFWEILKDNFNVYSFLFKNKNLNKLLYERLKHLYEVKKTNA